MNILVAAEESAGAQVIKFLSGTNHIVKAVLTKDFTSKNGSSVTTVAKNLGYLILPSGLVKEPSFGPWIIDNEIDVLINVHSLNVICTEVIQAVRIGAYNLHPGPLPAYAGLNAPGWAVYNREAYHGVTLHKIVAEIDAGDIIDEAFFPVSAKDTGLSVSLKCIKYGLPLLESFFGKLSAGERITGKKQDVSKRILYRANQIPNNGRIEWGESAFRIDAFLRACNFAPFLSPWGHPKTMVKGESMAILSLSITGLACSEKPGMVGAAVDGAINIATADYWVTIRSCLADGIKTEACRKLSTGDLLY
ncbi:MAG: hypothetical protein LAT67_02540 [Balneolales bacterium]|nr:hypothetical protein [Balneolales bacterium]